MTYEDILRLSPNLFSEYLCKKILFETINDMDSIEGTKKLGVRLVEIANNYTELTSLLSYARILKRNEDRIGTKFSHQDMIDKESNIESALKALDIQYKAINRNICLRESNNKELFLTGALT